MNNLFLLMKVQLQSILLRQRNGSNKKKKAAGIGTLFILAAAFMYMSVVYVTGMVMTFPEGYQYIALYVMGFMTVFMLLIFGYQSAGGHLFGFKDYDLLMSLPVRKSEVLISKFLSFLFLEYFYGFFLLAPSIVIVGWKCQFGFSYYLLGILAWMILPMVPMVLAAVLAYCSMYMAGKFKYKNLMNNVFYMVLMAVVFVLIFYYQTLMQKDAAQLLDVLRNITTYAPFMGWLFDGMVFGDWIHYLAGLIMNLTVFVLFVVVFSRSFMKLNGQIRSGYKEKNFKLGKSKAKSSFNALLSKELRTYFANNVYFMNTAIMPVLMVLGLGYLCFFQLDATKEFLSLVEGMLMPLLCGAILMFSLMSCTTNSSISLEGKNFDILKTFPVDTHDIFKAKVTLNLLVILPCSFLCSLMALIFFGLSIPDFLLCLLTSLTSSLFISMLGLILNLHFYRLDWDNAAVVVKQSMPVFITTLGGMVVGMGAMALGVYLLDYLAPVMIVLLLNGFLLLLDIGCFLYLKTGGSQQFYKIH